DYVIRKIRETELPRLVEMCNSHAEYERVEYDSKGKVHALQSVVFSDNPKLFCYVIEAAFKLEGYFTFTFDFSTWDAQTYLYLDCLYLEPPYRGLKIGDKIFDMLVAIAKKNRCVNIQWQTPVFNEKAIKFYN